MPPVVTRNDVARVEKARLRPLRGTAYQPAYMLILSTWAGIPYSLLTTTKNTKNLTALRVRASSALCSVFPFRSLSLLALRRQFPAKKNPPILVQSGETIQTSPVYYTVGTCVWIDSGNWVIRSRKRPTDSTLESGKPVPSS